MTEHGTGPRHESPPPPGISALGPGLALMSASLFALNTPVARGFVYAEGGDPITLLMARTATLACLTALAYIVARRLPRIPSGAGWPVAAIAFTLFIQGAGYLGSVAFIPVGLAAILFFTWPIMVALATPLFGGPRPTPLALFAFLLAFLGLAFAVGPSFETLDWRGILLVLMGAGGLAGYILTTRLALDRGVTQMTITLYSNFGAVIACAALLPFIAGGGLPDSTVGRLGVVSVCALYTGAFLLQLASLRITHPPTVAILFNIEPLVSIAVGAFVLHEVLNTEQYLGGVLVLSALFLYSRAQRRL